MRARSGASRSSMPDDAHVLGKLESLRVRRNELLIQGWVAVKDARPALGFRVSLAHGNVANVRWKWGLRNRGAKAHGADPNSGFEICAPLERFQRSQRNALICVAPLVRGYSPRSLFGILNPSFPIPPKSEWVLAWGSFLPEACAGLEALVHEARLKRNESVLEIGCGPGRMAYVLSTYLLPAGRYEGLEPVRRWVRRSKRTISVRFQNFRFREFAVRHALYNPRGRLNPAHARFPYRDSKFDLAFATSVFQHNRPAVVRHYLGEIARVLRPGGRALISCFLLDSDSARPVRKGGLSFPQVLEDCWTANADLPEEGIAFLRSDFCRWAEERDLVVQAQYDGSWRGRPWTRLYQDLVVLKKRKGNRLASRVLNSSRIQ